MLMFNNGAKLQLMSFSKTRCLFSYLIPVTEQNEDTGLKNPLKVRLENDKISTKPKIW